MKTLLAQVSGHGLGHWGQTAPVLAALQALQPELRIVVRSAIDERLIRARLPSVDEVRHCDSDRGLVMSSAVGVLVAESHRNYLRELADWERLVGEDCAVIEDVRPNLVLSNVGYRVLAAAARLGVPAIAMSSLNWADVYRSYARQLPDWRRVHDNMRAAYAGAEPFIRLQPGMPMPALERIVDVGPVAARHHASAAEVARVRATLGCGPGESLLLAALGGIPTTLDTSRWPVLENTRWLFPPEIEGRLANSLSWDPGLRFDQVVAAADLVLTKVGYGTMLEAACHGTRILYAARPDWPEDRPLGDWLQAHTTVARIDWPSIERGTFGATLKTLLARPRASPVEPSGNLQAARILARHLHGRDS
ncbi:MAG: hypothetical protein KDK91_16890 [Gammaproteobacteria bacterium]|nr:hypothetical protein [Gammaproteobacteria bacterium]